MNRVQQARHLRNRMTDAERALWHGLKERQIEGCKFRRQCPIGLFIADFVCLDRMLVVEVDGGQHAINQENDERRTAWLKKNGYTVLRFWNNEVLRQREAVLEAIRSALIDLAPGQARHLRMFAEAKVSEASFSHPHPNLPPQGEGAEKPAGWPNETTDFASAAQPVRESNFAELTGASVIASLPQRGRTGGGELNKAAAVHFGRPHPSLPPWGEGAEKTASNPPEETGCFNDGKGGRDSVPPGEH